MSASFDGQAILDAPAVALAMAQNGQPPPPDFSSAGSVLTTVGSEPARVFILLLRSVLDATNSTVNDGQQNVEAFHELVLDDDAGNQVKLRKLVFVRAQNCIPSNPGDPAAPFLCQLADVRWLAANPAWQIPFSKLYNVRAGGWGGLLYDQSTSDGLGTPWTWDGMLADIWRQNLQSVFIETYPGLPAGLTPNGNPENFIFEGTSAWEAFNGILDRLGCAIVCDMTQNETQFSIVQIGRADKTTSNTIASAISNSRLIYNAEYQERAAGRLPASVTVNFHKTTINFGTEETGQVAQPQWLGNATYSITISGNVSNTIPGTAATIWDDLPALFNSMGALTNLANLQARAQERVDDYYRQMDPGGLRLHQAFGGILKVQPCSILKAVSWRQRDDSALITEIFRFPGTAQFSFQGNQLVAKESTPLQSPFFGPGLPRYPFLMQDVQCNANSPTTGGLYEGFVLRCDDPTLPAGWVTREKVWVTELNGLPLSRGVRYHGRLVNAYQNRPVYSVACGCGAVAPSSSMSSASSASGSCFALSTDGGTTFAEANDDSIPTDSQPISVTLWMKPLALPNGERIGGAAVSLGDSPLEIGYSNIGTPFAYLPGTFNLQGAPLAIGTWAHLAFTYDGATASFYVNGVLVASSAVTLSTTQIGLLYFGKAVFDGNSFDWFSGLQTDVRIYTFGLDDSEVAAIYNNGMGNCFAPTFGLVDHWKFSEGHGVIGFDPVSGNDAVLIGAQWSVDSIGGCCLHPSSSSSSGSLQCSGCHTPGLYCNSEPNAFTAIMSPSSEDCVPLGGAPWSVLLCWDGSKWIGTASTDDGCLMTWILTFDSGTFYFSANGGESTVSCTISVECCPGDHGNPSGGGLALSLDDPADLGECCPGVTVDGEIDSYECSCPSSSPTSSATSSTTSSASSVTSSPTSSTTSSTTSSQQSASSQSPICGGCHSPGLYCQPDEPNTLTAVMSPGSGNTCRPPDGASAWIVPMCWYGFGWVGTTTTNTGQSMQWFVIYTSGNFFFSADNGSTFASCNIDAECCPGDHGNSLQGGLALSLNAPAALPVGTCPGDTVDGEIDSYQCTCSSSSSSSSRSRNSFSGSLAICTGCHSPAVFCLNSDSAPNEMVVSILFQEGTCPGGTLPASVNLCWTGTNWTGDCILSNGCSMHWILIYDGIGFSFSADDGESFAPCTVTQSDCTLGLSMLCGGAFLDILCCNSNARVTVQIRGQACPASSSSSSSSSQGQSVSSQSSGSFVSVICGACTAMPYQWNMSANFFVNGTCNNCTSVNGPFALTYDPAFQSPQGNFGCCWPGPVMSAGCIPTATPPFVQWLLYFNTTFGWCLVLLGANTGDTTYAIPSGSFNCQGQNTFSPTAADINANFSPICTSVVTPALVITPVP